MFTTNVITVEDCPNARSSCAVCKFTIQPTQPRVRCNDTRYRHLHCYTPKYPVAIIPSDISNHLQLAENQQALAVWMSQWNSQFLPKSAAFLHFEVKTCRKEFSRPHIEVFKYLTGEELGFLVSRVCRQWRDFAGAEELWAELLEREYNGQRGNGENSAKEWYVRMRLQACFVCRKLPVDVRVVCPSTKRPICAACYSKPGSSLFQLSHYATLLGVSPQYLRDSGITVYSHGDQHWVFSHLADAAVSQYRGNRRVKMMQTLENTEHFFSAKDLKKINSLNLVRAKYIGVVLKHRFEGEEDLVDLLRYIYAASESRGPTLLKLIRRNRLRMVRAGKAQCSE